MRITCPHCGERDQREFTYRGDATALARPAESDGPQAWDDYLHNRNNPAGLTWDMWYHTPCATWLVVNRNTVTHEIIETKLASGAAP